MKEILFFVAIICAVVVCEGLDGVVKMEGGLKLAANETGDSFCKKAMRNPNAKGAEDLANPCQVNCFTTYKATYYLKNGEVCGPEGSANPSVCYQRKCVEVNPDDLAYCQKIDPESNFSTRVYPCRVSCFNLQKSTIAQVFNVNVGECFYGAYQGSCVNGACRI